MFHLARRFFTSLSRRGPKMEDNAWVRTLLTPGECELWRRMAPRDQCHGVRTGRYVERAMGRTDQLILAAALLHDVGKLESRLGVPGRVCAALVGPVASPSMVNRLSARSGLVGEFGKLLTYPARGEALLVEAGSNALISSWAKEHHLGVRQWTVVTPELGALLQKADQAS